MSSIVPDSLHGNQAVPVDFVSSSGDAFQLPDDRLTSVSQPSSNGTPPDRGGHPQEPTSPPARSMTGGTLILEAGGQTHHVFPAQLQAEEYRHQLAEQLTRAGAPVLVDLRHLLEWTDAERWSVLAFLAGLNISCIFRAADTETNDLFVAVLNAMVDAGDVRRCGRGVSAAIDTAAMMHPEAEHWPAACARIIDRLKALGVTSYTRGEMKKLLRQRVANTQAEADTGEPDLISLHDVLPEAPGAEDVVVPSGWLVSAEGIAKGADEDAEVIIPAPMIITRRFTDVDGDAEHLGVAWPRDDRWHEQIVLRGSVMDSRSILQLADHGAPVTSNNSTDVVQYLADFETHNLEVLPRALAARQLGWQGRDGCHGFLWGRELLCEAPTATADMTAGVDAASHADVVFRGADDGDDQLAEGFAQAGSFQAWTAATQVLADYPRVQMAIYTALVPPLLEILHAENFIFSFAGATSQGKTITLRAAASVWGCADERSPTAAVGTWDATRVWFGRAPAVINHLPLVIDDTKRAQRDDVIAQMIYDVASGRGRGRGSKQGLARNDAFHTVMLTSGEAPITSFSEEGGTRPRVLEVWGRPFGRADEQTAGVVNALNDDVKENYGHLGPRFVRFLIEHRDQWPLWREHYRRLRTRYARMAGGNSVAARMAGHFATIRMAAILAHQAVDMPWGYRGVVTQMWPELTAEAPEADRAAAALRYVLSWAHGHRHHFFGSGGQHVPSSGWAGRWDVGRGPGGDWRYLGFLPNVLDKILTEGGFEPAAIRRLWWDREWLLFTAGKRMYRQRMGGNQSTYLVAIKREVVEQFEEPDCDDTGCRPYPRLATQEQAGT